MSKEIKDLKELKVGKKYLLTALATTVRTINGAKYLTTLEKVDSKAFYFLIDEVYVIMYRDEFSIWHIEEVPTPAIEMRIKGIDDLILQMEKPNTPTILELSLREILLAGGEITIRQSKE